MNSIDVRTTLLQADWRACVSAWTDRARGPASWRGKLMWNVRRFQQPKFPEDVGLLLGPAVLHFDAIGIGMRQGLLHVVHRWSSVEEGTATAEHLFLWLESGSVIIVPTRSLSQTLQVADFQARLDVLHEAALRSPVTSIPSALHDGPLPVAVRMVTAPSMADS